MSNPAIRVTPPADWPGAHERIVGRSRSVESPAGSIARGLARSATTFGGLVYIGVCFTGSLLGRLDRSAIRSAKTFSSRFVGPL